MSRRCQIIANVLQSLYVIQTLETLVSGIFVLSSSSCSSSDFRALNTQATPLVWETHMYEARLSSVFRS
jgi:hypothetical protein